MSSSPETPSLPLAHLAAVPDPWIEVWNRIQSLVLDSVRSPHSRRAYRTALDDFEGWRVSQGSPELSRATVQRYRASLEARKLAPSSINVRLSAIRKLASEAAGNQLLAPEVAAAIGSVEGARQPGRRTGNWLTLAQAEQMLGLPDRKTNGGKRDRALLSLLLCCGLRREELARLKFGDIQQREGRWVLVDLEGKGKRIRTVPMASWAKVAVDEWVAAAKITEGRLLRAVNKGDRIVGDGMTAQSIFGVVSLYGKRIGVPIAPHDLRRTFAKLAHQGRAALEQIQISLGHSSIQTTERYLGIEQDLTDAPCDHLGIRG